MVHLPMQMVGKDNNGEEPEREFLRYNFLVFTLLMWSLGDSVLICKFLLSVVSK